MNKERFLEYLEDYLKVLYQENKNDAHLIRDKEDELKALKDRVTERNGRILSAIMILSLVREGKFEENSFSGVKHGTNDNPPS